MDSRVASGRSRIPEIDGLRAIAVLAVLAFHFDLPLPGGFLGVDLFFAISGFVIARGLLVSAASPDSTPTILRRFYARRAARLLPAAVVVFGAVIVLAWLRGPAFGSLSRTIAHAASAFGGSSNWFLVAYPELPGETVRPLLHTWSLGVEEQLYLVLPILLFLGRRHARTVATAVCVAGVVIAVVSAHLWPDPAVAFFSTATRAAPMTLGVGLAALLDRAHEHLDESAGDLGRGRSGLLLMALSACLVPSLLTTAWYDGWLYNGGFVIVGVVVTAIVGLAAIGGTGMAMRALRMPVIQSIGARSYSLYLVHFPVAHLFGSLPIAPRTMVRVAISFAAAEVLHRFVEYRFLGSDGPKRLWQFAPLVMIVTTVLGFALAGASTR